MTDLDFGNPLTTELFVRTPELQQERDALMMSLYRNRKNTPDAVLHTAANQQMYQRFGAQVSNLIDEKTKENVGDAVCHRMVDSGSGVDYHAARQAAILSVHSELQELHEALPFPGLDQVANPTPVTPKEPMFPTAEEDFNRISGRNEI